MEPLLFEKKDSIGWITLNSPKQRNPLSLELMKKMQKLLNNIAKDKDIRVVVIRGKGPAFCTGHNMNELVGENYDISHFRQIFSICSDMMLTIHKIPQPEYFNKWESIWKNRLNRIESILRKCFISI